MGLLGELSPEGWFCDVKGPGCLNGGPRRWHCSNDCDWDACDVCHLAQHGHQHELELIDEFLSKFGLMYAFTIIELLIKQELFFTQ